MDRDKAALSAVQQPSQLTYQVIRTDVDDADQVDISSFSWCPETINTLRDFLITSRCNGIPARVIPPPRVLVLYGRKGSGKATLLHAGRYNEALGRYERVFVDVAFGWVYAMKLRSWNMEDFELWCKKTAVHIQTTETSNLASSGILIIVSNVHLLAACHSRAPGEALLQLLTTVRRCKKTSDLIRVVLITDESPSLLDPDLKVLIDVQCMMPLPGTPIRIQLALKEMLKFQSVVFARDSPLANVTWSVSTNDADVASDPDHPLQQFAINSVGCTPSEIVRFMQRTFRACSKPLPDGNTEYGAELFQNMYYNLEGAFLITPYNPSSKNEPIFAHARIHGEMPPVNVSSKCVVGKAGPVTMVDAPATEPDAKRSKVENSEIDEKVKKQEERLKRLAAAKRKEMNNTD